MATVETIVTSVFSTVLELHSGQLGFLAGTLIGILYWHDYQRSALGLMSVFYLLALGIVPATTRGLWVIQMKPWYFCTMLLFTAGSSMAGRVLVMHFSRTRHVQLGQLTSFND